MATWGATAWAMKLDVAPASRPRAVNEGGVTAAETGGAIVVAVAVVVGARASVDQLHSRPPGVVLAGVTVEDDDRPHGQREQAGDHRRRDLQGHRRGAHRHGTSRRGQVEPGGAARPRPAVDRVAGAPEPPPRTEPVAGQGERQGSGGPAQAQAKVVELFEPGPAGGALGQVATDPRGLGGRQLACHQPTEVLGGFLAVTGRMVADVELDVLLAGPGPHRQLRHIVRGQPEERSRVTGGSCSTSVSQRTARQRDGSSARRSIDALRVAASR